MQRTITLMAQTVEYPTGGGHFWVYLNWALGLQANGYQVLWLETIHPNTSADSLINSLTLLRKRLSPYGLESNIAFVYHDGTEVMIPDEIPLTPLQDALSSDLLINFRYALPEAFLKSFRRTALVDIDPGLFQHWVHQRQLTFTPHHIHFSISEAVGKPGSSIPDLGLEWYAIRPCVSLNAWNSVPLTPHGPFTTVTHWHANEYVTDGSSFYENTKRVAFLNYLTLPAAVPDPLELCLHLDPMDPEYELLKKNGWSLKHPESTVPTPEDYMNYIQSSAGEFSVCKPSCVRFQNGWISDRTICYLASGKPCVVEHCGPLSFLPNNKGLWRFKSLEEASHAIRYIREHYEEESAAARKIAEQYFDSKNITKTVVETALEKTP